MGGILSFQSTLWILSTRMGISLLICLGILVIANWQATICDQLKNNLVGPPLTFAYHWVLSHFIVWKDPQACSLSWFQPLWSLSYAQTCCCWYLCEILIADIGSLCLCFTAGGYDIDASKPLSEWSGQCCQMLACILGSPIIQQLWHHSFLYWILQMIMGNLLKIYLLSRSEEWGWHNKFDLLESTFLGTIIAMMVEHQEGTQV